MDTPNVKHIEMDPNRITGLCSVSIHFSNRVRCDRGSIICALWLRNWTRVKKTKWTHNGWVPDKMDKMHSNRRRTVNISPVQSATGFVSVQNFLPELLNINRHATDKWNVTHKYINGFQRSLFGYHLFLTI